MSIVSEVHNLDDTIDLNLKSTKKERVIGA